MTIDNDFFKEEKKLEEVLTLLNKISIFGGLNKKQVKEVIDLCDVKLCPKDSILFSYGQSSHHIYVILKGAVNLYFYENKELSEKYKTRILKEGDSFGAASLISIEPHVATAVCMEDSEILLMSRNVLLSLHKNNPDLFGRIILNIARELGRILHRTNKILFECIGNKERQD